jgi:hypothetical protein
MYPRLSDFLAAIRNTTTIEEERILIADEVARMRTIIRDCPMDDKPSILAKLLFLNITGENTSWGHMESLSLMSSDRLSYKRIGYLTVGHFLDEHNEIQVLLTQTITSDLQSTNPLFQAYALSFVANHGSAELLQAVYPDIERLTDSAHPGIRKRAGGAAVRVVRRIPELTPSFRRAVNRLIGSPKHAVVASGIILVTEMLRQDPSCRDNFVNLAKPVTKLLKALGLSRASNEFRLSIFSDPFLQIRSMQLLGELRQPSEDLDDALTSLVTTVDIRRNTGRSLLFQSVATIGQTAKKASLCGLAFNQIGRLFAFRDPNVLYSALSGFSQVLYHGREIIDRTSRDSVALQRYKSQIVHCLDHRDPSIRRRALDVVLALVDATNVESLIPEIIDYLHVADRDFRTEMVSKIYSAVQRFAPSVLWNFDIVHLLLIDSGPYVGNDLITSFCALIAGDAAVRAHALPLLSNTIYGYSTNQALVQVAAWVIGQFQATDDRQIVETMIKILAMPQTTTETAGYLITALAKIAARFRCADVVIPALQDCERNNSFEVQQRAGEMRVLLTKPDIWETTLIVPDFPQEDDAAAVQPARIVNTDQPLGIDDLLVDVQPNPKPGPEPAPPSDIRAPPTAGEALRTSDFVIYFEIQRNTANPRQLAIRSTIYNLTPQDLTKFTISYGVPVGWFVKAPILKDELLPKNGTRPIQHVLMLENRGNVPLMMKTHASYMFGCQPLACDSTLNPIFN